MSKEFVHHGHTVRVVFAAGARARLAEETERLDLRRLLVVSTPGHADQARDIAAPLGNRVVDLHAHATMHVPVATAAKAVAHARDLDVDGCVAIGGGSAIGLAKAVAKETGLPILAVPTTYAGSEMTPIWGLTDAGRKTTGRDPKVLPATVIYDPELTVTLPVGLSVTSGINALAHAAEALYAPDLSPVIALMAEESVKVLATALPQVVGDPTDIDARSDALYGAWLAGACLGSTTMSLHHKLCHVLGGAFDLPHSPTHAAVLPHVLAFNLQAAPTALEILRRALGVEDPAVHIHTITADLGAARSLRELGLPAEGIDQVIQQTLATPCTNPRDINADGIRRVMQASYDGRPPSHNPL